MSMVVTTFEEVEIVDRLDLPSEHAKHCHNQALEMLKLYSEFIKRCHNQG
jgi:hypothetical protein